MDKNLILAKVGILIGKLENAINFENGIIIRSMIIQRMRILKLDNFVLTFIIILTEKKPIIPIGNIGPIDNMYSFNEI